MKTKRATLIHPDGTEETIEMPTNGSAALRKLYEVINCTTVEHIELRHTVDNRRLGFNMWMDEDGKAKRLPVNEKATKLLHEAGGMPFDNVTGRVVID